MLLRFRVSIGIVFLVLVSLPAFLPPPAPVRADGGEDRLPRHRRRLGVTEWHRAGYLGRGVKVAVLDGDFTGYKEQLGETLPAHIDVRSFRDDGRMQALRSGHGLRAAQVVHALAPEAELLLVNWEPSRADRFFDALRWAKAQGARIITCSVTASLWGDGEGGGPYHRRLSRFLGAGDREGQPLFFCSAGNNACSHWAGPFQRSSRRLHQWKPGVVDNSITPEDDTPVHISLLHKPGAAYQMQVCSGDGGVIAQRISNIEDSLAATVVSFKPRLGESYRLRVRLLGGEALPFHCVVRSGQLGVSTRSGSICCFPADNPAVVTVGAVDWFNRRTWYSACGKVLGKPDLVAPVPFPCPGQQADFHGTSAAAPQAAALACLLAQKAPHWTARQLREALLANTRPIGQGPSRETGRGRLWLPRPER
jgi:subtilisin family serine protease